MKALFILADNIYLTPYLNFYTELLKKNNYEYDIMYWDKNNNEILSGNNYIRFNVKNDSKISKLIGYYKYKKYIRQIEKKGRYDLIIPLHSIVNFIIFDLLLIKYKKRYIYDIRDYSYEKLFLFRYIQKKLVKYSLINIISSEGYKKFLPSGIYYITHNMSLCNYNNFKQLKKRNRKTFEISYIGLIRFMEQNKKILLFFKNDKRFHINFIGTNAKKLENFCNNNNINNVTLIDTFDSKETLKYYKDADMIMNLYGNNNPLLDNALSNKLYYAAALYKPILVCENTYMEKITKEYKMGFTIKMNKNSERDNLYKFMKELNRKEFIKNCDKFMDKVIKDKTTLEEELTNRILKLAINKGEY